MHELAEVQEILEMEEKKLFAIEEICKQAVEELKERQEKELPPHEYFMYQSYLHQITLDMEIQRRRVAEAAKTCSDRRVALISASQGKRAAEKVRDRELN